jgi:hypothetical protein
MRALVVLTVLALAAPAARADAVDDLIREATTTTTATNARGVNLQARAIMKLGLTPDRRALQTCITLATTHADPAIRLQATRSLGVIVRTATSSQARARAHATLRHIVQHDTDRPVQNAARKHLRNASRRRP